jgi:SHS2 domain-containing protein
MTTPKLPGDHAAPDALFREIEHTGDLAIEVDAPTRRELFRRAALALGSLLIDRSKVAGSEARKLTIAAATDSDLLHDLLSELLTIVMVDAFVWSDADIEETESGLDVTLHGEQFDPDRHDFRGEIKAVTYHQLAVDRIPEGWSARVIFDV